MQQQLAVSGLTPKDIQTLCRAAQVAPPEDPALNLEQHLAIHSLTVQDLWAKLSGSTDVHVMVACAVLRGAVQHCPPDPRLNPAPLPKLGHKPKNDAPKRSTRRAPSEDAPAQPVVRPWQRPDAVVVAFKPNPRRAGSAAHTRYAQYAVGRTCLELLGLGLRRRDFARDVRRGWLTFGLPEGAPAEAPAWPAGVAGEDEGGDE